MDTFRLNNGMTIEFSPAEQWSGEMFVKMPEKNGEEAMYQFAANHLIEHCFVGGFMDSETRNGYVRHQLPSMTEEKGSIGALKSLMKTAYALRHPMLENVSAEKEAIVEEWSMCSTAPEKFKFWGGFMHAVTPDKWDMIDETITPEKGMRFLNHQADYTRNFTFDELQKHALATYGGKQITLRLAGPVTSEEMQELIGRSGLEKVPSEHENGQEIDYKHVPEANRYQDISRVNMQIDANMQGISKDDTTAVIRRIGKALHNNPKIGLYTYEKNNGVMSFSFIRGKEDLVNAQMQDTLKLIENDNKVSIGMRIVAQAVKQELATQMSQQQSHTHDLTLAKLNASISR